MAHNNWIGWEMLHKIVSTYPQQLIVLRQATENLYKFFPKRNRIVSMIHYWKGTHISFQTTKDKHENKFIFRLAKEFLPVHMGNMY